MIYSDQAIIQSIRENNTKKVKECFTFLYKKNLSKAVNYFRIRGVREDEVEDFFQEAILVFYESVRDGRYQLKSKISTFLFSIIKYLVIKKYNKERLKIDLADNEKELLIIYDDDNIEEKIISEEKKQVVTQYMNALKEDCKRILTCFYYYKMPMEEIAVEMGYKNEQIARNKKVRCLKALQEIVLMNKVF